MEYPNMELAARLLLIDQGLSGEGAAATVLAVVNHPENCPNLDGVIVTPAMFAEFETWADTLSEEEMDIACCGCDETEPNGPITYTGGDIAIVIPMNCARVLEALFDSLIWDGM
jgi:hypothetical protein